MKITAILEQTVPIRSPIRNAVIDFSQMTASAVAIVTDVEMAGQRLIGYGFHSNGRYAQGGILRERLIPRLLGAAPAALLTDDGSNFDPLAAWQVMMHNEKPGGHGERSVAVGTIDMALWDLVAKLEQKPLYRVLADRYNRGQADPAVWVYAAGGYYHPGKDLNALQNELKGYLDLGYDTVKMKVGGAPLDEDRRRIEAALAVLGSKDTLAVDANGRFERDAAVRFAEAIQPYGLRWCEEPGEPLDFALLAEVAAASATPIATGENLFSLPDSLNLIRYGGLDANRDILQMDPVLSYGLVEYQRILRMLDAHGWSRRRCIPHGGHQFSLHIAAGLGIGGNESYPGVFQPFGGFADNTAVENGTVTVPDAPGIGIELKANLMEVFAGMTGAVT